MNIKKMLILCTTDSMIWNFLIPHIKNFKENGIEVECACSRTGVYFDELVNKYGMMIFEIPFHRSPYSLENVTAYRKLKTLIKKREYDLIFCHEPVGGALGRMAGHACRVKVVYMAHGFHFYKGAPKKNWIIYYSVEKYLSRYTDLLITINHEDYEASKEFKAKKNYLLNGIGVDLGKFQIRSSNYFKQNFHLSEDSVCLLSVGELIKRKNHETIIRAIAKLNDPKIHLFIAGEGELGQELSNLISGLNLENNVHLLGFCRNISELCNACDIFIFPSVHEGLSMALMEAMACGKPVIASNIRGNTDLINEKGGILVDTFDIDGYARSIAALSKQDDYRRLLGSYNSEHIKEYDLVAVKKQLLDIIKSV